MSQDAAVRASWKRGLSGFCATDHSSLEARSILARTDIRGISVFIGKEMYAKHGKIIVLGLKTLPPGVPDAQQLVDHGGKSKGFSIAVHPFRRRGTSLAGHMEKLKGLMAVEALNGGYDSEENLDAQDACLRLNLLPVAGSDAHFPGDMGLRATWFPDPMRPEAGLITALGDGQGRPVFPGEDNKFRFRDQAGKPKHGLRLAARFSGARWQDRALSS